MKSVKRENEDLRGRFPLKYFCVFFSNSSNSLLPEWISWSHLPLLGISGTFYLAFPQKGMRLWTKEIWACVFCPKASVRFFEDVNLIFTVMSPWVSSKYRPFRWWLLNKCWVEEERDGTKWMERRDWGQDGRRFKTLIQNQNKFPKMYAGNIDICSNYLQYQRAGVELNLKQLWWRLQPIGPL